MQDYGIESEAGYYMYSKNATLHDAHLERQPKIIAIGLNEYRNIEICCMRVNSLAAFLNIITVHYIRRRIVGYKT